MNRSKPRPDSEVGNEPGVDDAAWWRQYALKLESELQEISRPFKFRFTFENQDSVWDRDVLIAHSRDWPKLKEAHHYLESWSSFPHGPLIVAMGPFDVVCQSN